MIKSMTGYGVSILRNDLMEVKVEMKSVNNRYLDIQVRSPKFMLFMEDSIKKATSSVVARGKIDVFINVQLIGTHNVQLNIDYSLAEEYVNKIKELNKFTGNDSEINIIDVLKLDDSIFSVKKEDYSENKEFIETIMKCVEECLTKFLEMKAKEGYNIETDLNAKLSDLSDYVSKVEDYSESVVKLSIENLKTRINSFLESESIEIDNDRLMNEIVFYTDKLSIDEEIVRMKSHISMFYDILNDENVSGKKLDFLIQEMNRETNTIGSKSGLIEITNIVIEMKAIIEMLREQVQNIE